MIWAELCSHRPLFRGYTEVQQLQKIFQWVFLFFVYIFKKTGGELLCSALPLCCHAGLFVTIILKMHQETQEVVKHLNFHPCGACHRWSKPKPIGIKPTQNQSRPFYWGTGGCWRLTFSFLSLLNPLLLFLGLSLPTEMEAEEAKKKQGEIRKVYSQRCGQCQFYQFYSWLQEYARKFVKTLVTPSSNPCKPSSSPKSL